MSTIPESAPRWAVEVNTGAPHPDHPDEPRPVYKCIGCRLWVNDDHPDWYGHGGDCDRDAEVVAVSGTSPVELAHTFSSAWRFENSYTPSRGWFHREANKLWAADDEALVVRQRVSNTVAAHAAEESSASLRAVRTRTVVTEMEPLMSHAGSWDTDLALVGLPDDAVLDLATGNVRAAGPDDRISRRLGAVPDFDVEPAAWLKTLEHTCHNAIEHEWLRLWCGLCLTGHTRDAKFVFLQGPGGGGKGIIMRTVIDVAGEYHVGLPNHAFVGSGSRHPEWIARLAGARLATVADMPRGNWQNIDVLKSLVGGDPVTANFMRMGSFTFESTAKVMLGGNHQPALGYSDSGFARRITLIPAARVTDPDPHLRQTLVAELPAICGWFVRAAYDYLNTDGLAPAPERWSTATTDYLETDDKVGAWFRERCRHDPNAFTPGPDLVSDYNAYAGDNIKRASRLYEWLTQYPQQGVIRTRRRPAKGANPVDGFAGVRLTNHPAEP